MSVAVSIVSPCYNEEKCLAEFYRRASAACRATVGDSHEIILVDDGSRDATWEVISDLSERDPHVKGVHLMRNHGHQLAATAGLALASGERVLLIDSDLQDPPELLGEMMAIMDKGADVVYGKRRSRAGESWFKLATAAAFYRILSRLSSERMPEDTGDFRLMTRNVVDVLVAMPERDRFIRGMVTWIGGHQVPLLYERDARFAGTTKYTLSKMIRFALDAVTSFSTVPLKIASWLGLCVAAFAMVLLVYALWQWAAGHVVDGWTSTMAAITLFAGVQLLVLGIIGEYLGRLALQAKGRPLFLIESVVMDGERYSVPVEFWNMPRTGRERVLEELAGGAGRSSSRPLFARHDVSESADLKAN